MFKKALGFFPKILKKPFALHSPPTAKIQIANGIGSIPHIKPSKATFLSLLFSAFAVTTIANCDYTNKKVIILYREIAYKEESISRNYLLISHAKIPTMLSNS